jgi:iron-sulfur cluster repair protein YtfE (RIC family)
MRASEVRHRILSDHDQLRCDFERVEVLASEVLRRPDARLPELRAVGEAMLQRLAAHMRWEESYLFGALRDADAWGAERAARLVRDHRSQRELLRVVRERLCDGSHPAALLVAELRRLVVLLRADLGEEERDLLDERVLRDDVVAIDQATG